VTARRLSTVVRLTAASGLALGVMLGAARAVAEPAPATELETASAEGPAAQAPDASAAMTASIVQPRSWLRDTTKPARAGDPGVAPAEPGGAPWRATAVLAVLSGLGVAALAARRRRPKTVALPESATRVRVLSSARIGPKANAVVAEVGGRVLLLGVTDTSVARLAWLDRDAAPKLPRRATASAPVELAPEPSRAPVETADAEDGEDAVPERSMATRFGEVLDRALGVRPAPERHTFRANPGVAALLAAGVEDVVQTPRHARVNTAQATAKTLMMEDQVAGLVQRRRRA
jgi:flagellar biogenesis protein FliO